MNTKCIFIAAVFITVFHVWGREPVQFTEKVTASAKGEGAVVSFKVSRPTDVEIAVLDSTGKAVRHLAAGAVGGKFPPPPPLQKGLAQEITWDGKDDFGKKVKAEGLKVRVRAGTGVTFGRTLSDSPYIIGHVKALGTDKDSNLYILNMNFNCTYHVQVYDADGTYLRSVVPFPANLPPESLRNLAYWDSENNRPLPRNRLDLYARFFPLNFKAGEGMSMMPDIRDNAGLLLHSFNVIFRLEKKGGTGGRELEYCDLFKKGLIQYEAFSQSIFTAVSPDGKTLYAAGPCAKLKQGGKPLNPLWPPGQVFSMNLEPREKMKPFIQIGLPDGWQKKSGGGGPVRGLATDSKGNIYVCDRANERISVFDPKGAKLGTIPVAEPHHIRVHPEDSSVYVLTLASAPNRTTQLSVIKFSGFKDPKELGRIQLGTRAGRNPQMAVTVKNGQTGLWLAGVELNIGRTGRCDVTRYDEKDKDGKIEFVPAVKLHEKDPDALPNHDVMSVDPFTEDVYVNNDYSLMYRYNGLTGEGGHLHKIRKSFYSTDLTVGPDGYLYVRTGSSYSGPFERLDRDLRPVPFKSGSHFLSDYIYSRFGAGYAEKGIAVTRDGTSYVLNMYNWAKYAVFKFNPDGTFGGGPYLKGKMPAYKDRGKRITSAIIGPVPSHCGGLRVDSKGNIYMGVLVLPPGHKPPKPLINDSGWASLVGSILKFTPAGGEWIVTHPKLVPKAWPECKTSIPPGTKGIMMENGNFFAGATQVYPEFAPFSGAVNSPTGKPPIGRENCACRSPRFDIDPYDRLYIPNAVVNSVRIHDNAGNLILTFGSYGNYDSAGPGSLIPDPEIAFGWPIGVGVSDEYIYVCDQLNRRILRADKTYEAHITCDIK